MKEFGGDFLVRDCSWGSKMYKIAPDSTDRGVDIGKASEAHALDAKMGLVSPVFNLVRVQHTLFRVIRVCFKSI